MCSSVGQGHCVVSVLGEDTLLLLGPLFYFQSVQTGTDCQGNLRMMATWDGLVSLMLRNQNYSYSQGPRLRGRGLGLREEGEILILHN